MNAFIGMFLLGTILVGIGYVAFLRIMKFFKERDIPAYNGVAIKAMRVEELQNLFADPLVPEYLRDAAREELHKRNNK